MSDVALRVERLEASVGDTKILDGIDLELPFGQMHAIMGPNGSGKSTLCHALTGRPGYEVRGSATLDGVELLDKGVDERSRLGLVQAFQYPVEVAGVDLDEFLREAAAERGLGDDTLETRLRVAADRLGMSGFLGRAVNADLSGGEKKRSEIFQMAVLAPKVAVLDEIDSGLDIDAVRDVAAAVEEMRSPGVGVLMITHYSRVLRYTSPDRIHVMMGGRIVESGGPELADELEAGGYEALRARLGLAAPVAREKPPAHDPFSDLPFED